MRRIALLFALVVTASLIPGKKVRAESAVAATAGVSGAVAAVTENFNSQVKVLVSEARATRAYVREARHDTGRSVGLAVGWLVIVALVGFVLMAFGADKLDIVIRTMQEGIGKSLGSGLLGQLAILPGAIAVMVLLAATLIGILLIPLGLVAFMFVVAGIAMFGFIAVATMTGAALTRNSQDETPNGAMLRSFLTGTAIYLGMWLIASAFSGVPLLGPMLASFASAVTFIAVTTGFGAVLLAYWQGKFKRGDLAV
jgi:MFS family permease